AAAGGDPVHAHGAPVQQDYSWLAGGLPPQPPRAAQPAGVGAGGLPGGTQPAQPPARAPAQEEGGGGRRPAGSGRKTYSPEEYAAAAAAIQPGCEHWNVKDKTWPAGVCKPTIPAMRDEMKRRGGTPRTTMSAEDLCSWLYTHAMPPPAPGGGATQGGAGGAGSQPPTQPLPTTKSWVNKIHYPRLIECIRAHPVEFSKRDAKPSNRGELDGVDRNSAWRTIVAKFNDDDFQPVSMSTHSADWDDVLQDLDPSSRCGLSLNAKDGEKKFKELSSKLRKAYANFKKSGQGDKDHEPDQADQANDDDDDDEDAYDEADEDEGVDDSDDGHDTGSDFWDFCQGDVILLYAYKWLLLDGLLDSAIGDMPEGTTSNSDAPGETVQPRTDSSRRKSDASDALYAISGAVQAPVHIAQSALQKRVMHFASQAAKRKAQVLQAQLSAEKERHLAEVIDQIDRLQSSGKPVPARLVIKRDRLTRELDEEERQMAAGGGSDDEPHFEDDPLPSAPAAQSSKAAGKRARRAPTGVGGGGSRVGGSTSGARSPDDQGGAD
ncbi:MAG: hypothetical protein ACPIOQ_01825, partial [Promethearchaeia archaeon]